MYLEKKKKQAISHPLAHSPTVCYSQGYASSSQELRTHFESPIWIAGTNCLSCRLQVHTRSQEYNEAGTQRQSLQDETQALQLVANYHTTHNSLSFQKEIYTHLLLEKENKRMEHKMYIQ